MDPAHHDEARLSGGPPSRYSNGSQPSRTHADAVMFDHVGLAFDDNVVLRDVSFVVPVGRMTILIGSSGAGKSVVLKLILGLLKPDSGVIRVNGQRIDSMTEVQMMRVRDDIGMLFQESALFDSLTVADNVGYKLYEETRHAGRGCAAARRGGLGVHRPG